MASLRQAVDDGKVTNNLSTAVPIGPDRLQMLDLCTLPSSTRDFGWFKPE
jgi:hypothetical protein